MPLIEEAFAAGAAIEVAPSAAAATAVALRATDLADVAILLTAFLISRQLLVLWPTVHARNRKYCGSFRYAAALVLHPSRSAISAGFRYDPLTDRLPTR